MGNGSSGKVWGEAFVASLKDTQSSFANHGGWWSTLDLEKLALQLKKKALIFDLFLQMPPETDLKK